MNQHAGLDIPAAVTQRLTELGIDALVMACDPDYADTAAFCTRYGVAPQESANTIVVVSKRGPLRRAACVVLASTRLDVNRTVCRLLDVAKASFASAEQTGELTGMMIGGVTPFGLPPDLPIFVDARVVAAASVVIGGGSRSAKLRITPRDLLRIPGATVVEGLATERV